MAQMPAGEIQMVTAKRIPQNQMTSECWIVQLSDVQTCDTCEFIDTDECGGQDIRSTGKNEKGFKVPLGEGL